MAIPGITNKGLKSAIKEAGFDRRQMYILTEVLCGESYKSVGEDVGLNPGAVSRIYNSCISKLRKILGIEEIAQKIKYSPDFKADAVKLSAKLGVKVTSRYLGVSPSTLTRWSNREPTPSEELEGLREANSLLLKYKH